MMNQHTLWFFEFAPNTPWPDLTPFTNKKTLPPSAKDRKQNNLKWEFRYFWDNQEQIILNVPDHSLLCLDEYHHKYKKDCYYLLPDCNYNIKRRHDKLLYKPLIQRTPDASSFGTKIVLDSQEDGTASIPPELKKIIPGMEQKSLTVTVEKESHTYKFATTPTIKLELARLEIQEKIYFSICIEGKSLGLVKTISKHLLGERLSCDYVSFLKQIKL